MFRYSITIYIALRSPTHHERVRAERLPFDLPQGHACFPTIRFVTHWAMLLDRDSKIPPEPRAED